MAAISGKDTKLEVAVRSSLFLQGLRFRKNVKELPGKPDIGLPKYHTVIFVHGCFWHGHSCKKGTRPTTNVEFWNTKIQSNIDRDGRVKAQLEDLGWRILIVWNCELKNKTLFQATMQDLILKIIQ